MSHEQRYWDEANRLEGYYGEGDPRNRPPKPNAWGGKMRPESHDAEDERTDARMGIVQPPNPSGIRPAEYKIVVRPDDVEERIGSIIKADITIEREKYGTMEGTIVAVSERAFSEADIWGANPPVVGSKIMFAKHAGLRRKCKDGTDYLVMADKDVVAVLE